MPLVDAADFAKRFGDLSRTAGQAVISRLNDPAYMSPPPTPPQLTPGITHILSQHLRPRQAPPIAILLLHLLDTTECASRSEARLLRCRAATHVLRSERLEMGVNFFVEALVEYVSAKQRADSRQQLSHHSVRNAATGFRRIARRAGIADARQVTPASSSATPTSVAPSVAPTPMSTPRIS